MGATWKCRNCGSRVREDGWNEDLCPRCMLRAAAGDVSATEDSVGLSTAPADTVGASQPVHIGPYKILRELGEGGMGVVYLADQSAPIRRRVALKVIKPGMDSRQVVARFETERQALARLNHPNVTRVLDAGTSNEGRPYFVMEYVHGLPIHEHCDRHRFDARRRIELFLQVCEGVQHAHQRGIIHRDIKPTNVLVSTLEDKPVPKIIDFGIAKAVAQRLMERTIYTELGRLVGTPEYMSPEQANAGELDIDTRTDVYSLGALLYELLVGVRPFDAGSLREAGYEEMCRRIREELPSQPSTRLASLGDASKEFAHNRSSDPRSLVQLLSGDLDWITMRALEKERGRRYASVSEFAEDLRRHLRNEPVIAGPPSIAYRTRKFVRRHRLGVGIGTCIVALLTGALIVFGVQARRIASERDRANREAVTARRVSEFLTEMFEVSDPKGLASDATAAEILAEGADRIRSELSDQPLVRARLMTTIGAVQRNLGLFAESVSMLREALEVYEQSGEESFDTGVTMQELALALHELGASEDESRRLLEGALRILETTVGTEHSETARVLNNLANSRMRSGEIAEARRLYEQSIQIYEKLGDGGVASSLNDYALLLSKLKDYEGARNLQERQLAAAEARGDRHTVAMALNNLGVTHRTMGDYRAALDYFKRAAAVFEDVLGPNHAYVAIALGNLADMHVRLGNPEAALPYFERCLEIRDRVLPKGHELTIGALASLATTLEKCGHFDQARSQYQRLIDEEEDKHGGAHFHVARTTWNLAKLELAHGTRGAADRLFRRGVSLIEELAGKDAPEAAYWQACYRALVGDRDAALAALRLAVERGLDDEAMPTDPDLASLREDPEFEAITAEFKERERGRAGDQ